MRDDSAANGDEEWDRLMQAVADGRIEDYWRDRDVRRVLPELRSSGRLRLDAVPWGLFFHAYGPADDVARLIEGLWVPDEAAASNSLSELWNAVRHQGGSSAPGALSVPFLVRAAADPAVHGRAALLRLAAEAGHRNHFGRDRRQSLLQVIESSEEMIVDVAGYPVPWVWQAAREALTDDVALLIGLLDDAEPAVRALAAYALATALVPPLSVETALRARLDVEGDQAVRISLVLAVTQLAIEGSDAGTAVAWTEQLWGDEHNPTDVRFAAALAWLCATPEPPPQRLLEVLAEATTPEMEQVMLAVPWPDDVDRHGGLAAWLVTLLGGAPDERAWLAARLSAAPYAATTKSALQAALSLASEWRSPSDAMIDLIAGHLTHPVPTVSQAAARHLAAAGEVPEPASDRLAEAIVHDDDAVRAWAVLALAHRGNARAVTPLSELLRQPHPPWPVPRQWNEMAHQAHRLVDRLDGHGDELLPAILHRLTENRSGEWRPLWHDLLYGLQEWGEPATGAVEVLTALLPHAENASGTIATILGRIGPAASAAVSVLDQVAAHAGANELATLVWARWRITGERTTAMAQTLARLATVPPNGPQAFRLLADLGPAVAAHERTIRTALTDNYFWVRAEAAYALWRATGDASDSLPILLDILAGRGGTPGFGPVHAAITRHVAEKGPAARAAVPLLTAFLDGDRRPESLAGPRHDPISWDQHCQRLSALALQRIQSDR